MVARLKLKGIDGITVPPFGFKVFYRPIRVEDIVRWGVWLGRHI